MSALGFGYMVMSWLSGPPKGKQEVTSFPRAAVERAVPRSRGHMQPGVFRQATIESFNDICAGDEDSVTCAHGNGLTLDL